MIFKFQIQPATPAKASLLGEEIARLDEYLKIRNIPFEARPETMSDFGKVTRATFTVSEPLPCEISIRVDYDKSSVEFELVNVRNSGQVRFRLEANTLDDVVDVLARYVLGVDDDFDKILKRR